MKREIIRTKDGSNTIHIPEWDEQYHSKHGAIQEAYHVFIQMGLFFLLESNAPEEIRILEIGFGTGLNAYITYIESKKVNYKFEYTGIEAFPVPFQLIEQLNYPKELNDSKESYYLLHRSPWSEKVIISDRFKLIKNEMTFEDINFTNTFHLIYFDAFGARVQPELWTEVIFEKMFNAMKKGGVLVTYSAKGSVRRAMNSVGFIVERLPGPPGKREMLRAIKP